MNYRKKPVVIQAIQWNGDNDVDVMDFMGSKSLIKERGKLVIPTLEGEMQASKHDWIIRGVNGEHYPCKPEIFHKTYEPA